MYDRLLVPTDGSLEDERAIKHALELATAHGATVVAVSVVNTAGYVGLPMETAMEGISAMMWEKSEVAVNRVVELASGTVKVETVVARGVPHREILEVATRQDCDLIVMGTHGRGGLNRLLLGSVAEAVLRNASIPVLAVNVENTQPSDELEAAATVD